MRLFSPFQNFSFDLPELIKPITVLDLGSDRGNLLINQE